MCLCVLFRSIYLFFFFRACEALLRLGAHQALDEALRLGADRIELRPVLPTGDPRGRFVRAIRFVRAPPRMGDSKDPSGLPGCGVRGEEVWGGDPNAGADWNSVSADWNSNGAGVTPR